MRASTARTAVSALLVLLVATATGCSSGGGATPADTTPPTATVTPTSTLPAEVPAGVIITPPLHSTLRADIMKAASAGLGLSGKTTVYQLFAQDGAAVGDLQPATGSRMLFAVSGGPDAWELVWSAPFGSSLASGSKLTAVDPGLFTELARALDFIKKAPRKPVAKPVVAPPTLKSFETFALKSTKSFAGSAYTGTFTIQAKIARDSKGIWWGNAIAEPSESGLEPIGVWARYSSGKWSGEIADFSTEGADADFFPADVLAKLAL